MTLQMRRVTRVTFKYHGTLVELIGAPRTHLSCCSRILLREITSSTVSFCSSRDWLDFFPCSFSPFDRVWLCSCCRCCCFLCMKFHRYSLRTLFRHFSLVLYGMCDSAIMSLWYFIWQWGCLSWWSTWNGCRLPVHLHTVLQQSVMLYQ